MLLNYFKFYLLYKLKIVITFKSEKSLTVWDKHISSWDITYLILFWIQFWIFETDFGESLTLSLMNICLHLSCYSDEIFQAHVWLFAVRPSLLVPTCSCCMIIPYLNFSNSLLINETENLLLSLLNENYTN